MRTAAKIVGAIWMLGCACIWIYMGFFMPANDCSGWGPYWLGPRMFCEAGFGIYMIPFILAAPGFFLLQWGFKEL
jgi:hypothetical protein